MDMEQFFALLKEQLNYEISTDSNQTSVYHNNTWIETDFHHLYPGLVIPYLIFGTIASVTGTIGNILIIGAVIVSNRLRTTGNMFIVNLAVADILITAFVFPLSLVGALLGPEFFLDKLVLCHVISGICLMACVCSMCNMAAIALNRYVFLCHNQFYATMYTKRSTCVMCLGFWILIALLTELPVMLGWGGHNYDTKTMGCTWDRFADYSFTLFLLLVTLGTPLFLVFGFYFRIFCFVRSSRKRLRKFAIDTSATHMDMLLSVRKEEEFQLARTLFIVFFAYFSCWSPYFVVTLYDRDNQLTMAYHLIPTAIGHSNSALNSIIYAASNKQFRIGYKQFLGIFTGLFQQGKKTDVNILQNKQHIRTF